MIGYIKGEILEKNERDLIIVCGGVGYDVFATTQTIENSKIGQIIGLWTHLAVKEDALDLYGFIDKAELKLFRLLIGISGIGPKSALNILTLADVATLAHAIKGGNASYLTKVSGIGKRLAEKIVLELKEKMDDFGGADATTNTETEVLDALEALGYGPRDTRDVVRSLSKENLNTHDIIRKALQILGGHQ